LNIGKERATLKGHTAAVTSVALSEGGTTLVSGGEDGTVKIWMGGVADGSKAVASVGPIKE
jgi:WD40 repeat protein